MPPPGVPSIKQLDRLVTAALAQALAGGGPSPTSAPISKYSFLTDPKFLQALGAPASITPVGNTGGQITPGRLSGTQQPAANLKLQASVSRIGNQKEHHSLFHKILGAIEKPYHAITGFEHEAAAKASQLELQHGSATALLNPKNWLKEAEAGLKGVGPGFHGKTNYSGTDVLDAADPNPAHTFLPGPLKAALGLGMDVGFDPLSYTGIGTATKVKDLGRTEEAIRTAKEVQKTLKEAGHTETEAIPKLLLGGDLKEGKFYKGRGLPNSAQREEVMQRVAGIADKYGIEKYNKFLADLTTQATKHVASQGYKKYKTVKELRSALKGSSTLKAAAGNVSKVNLDQYNNFVRRLIDSHAKELGAGIDPMKIKKAAAANVLDVAAKSNLAGKEAAQQLDKRMAIRLAGTDVARIKLPRAITTASRAVAGSKVASKPLEFVDRMHDVTNRLFRTGSHLDPVVNAIRMATHSSVVDKVNNHVIDLKSVWGKVSMGDRKRVADLVTKGQVGAAKIAGGHSHRLGQDVTDLASHTNDELHHLQSLVGNHEEALVSFKEFNRQMPSRYAIPKKYFNSSDWLRNAWSGHFLNQSADREARKIGEDPATFLHTIQKAILAASAVKERDATLIDRFGHRLRGGQGYGMNNAKNPAVEMLRDRHGYRTPKLPDAKGRLQPIPAYEKHVFHPDVASAIEAMHTMMAKNARMAGNHLAGADQMLDTFNKSTQMFKSVVTKFNPGFHERNLIGEVMNSMADGVLSSKPYRKALQVLRLHGRMAFDTGEDLGKRGARIHNGIMPDAYERAKIAAVDGNDVVLPKHFTITSPDGTVRHIRGATADMIWHAYVANGLKTGWISTEFGKVVAGGNARRALRGVNTGAQHVTENIEDYSRLAHFISRIERSKFTSFESAAEDAAQYVRKFHFDYNDFTDAEKNVISKVIPFYKWTRKNIPLQMALLYQKPGYMLTQMKALNAISQSMGYRNNGDIIPNAGEVMPIWLKDALAVPVGQGGSGTRYLDAPLPTRDAFKFFGEGAGDTTTNLAYMLNPFIKDPIELKTGHQVGGAPIQTDRYFAGMTPYTNLLNNLRNKNNTGKTTNLLQFLSGLGIVENTPARIKSELKRQQSEGSARRKKYRTSHGMLPVGGRS